MIKTLLALCEEHPNLNIVSNECPRLLKLQYVEHQSGEKRCQISSIFLNVAAYNLSCSQLSPSNAHHSCIRETIEAADALEPSANKGCHRASHYWGYYFQTLSSLSCHCNVFGDVVLYHTLSSSVLTHWGWEKIAAISQMTFSNAFSSIKMFEFWLQFHWILFLRVHLTIHIFHWFR